MHSSDQLSMEITTLIAETPEWITGIQSKSAKDFFDFVLERIIALFSDVGGQTESARRMG
ncbi:hypothetical protein [Plasticicumulans sp.]|uniref:hypothetical protein n=1 Tax=Plasticicumulans sp. TaxID=2307179 RepID=UPI003958EEB9